MSTKHLSEGTTCPPLTEGKLRLYSMEFCPYAQRARLVLLAKNIPHDIVNVNLIKKPDWIFKLHPEGKVPALDTGSEVIVESLVICDYLDEKYPEPPLYPAEPAAKANDKELIGKLGLIIEPFYKIIIGIENKTPEEWLKELQTPLEFFENELKKRGVYFGGDRPGMVDFMLWPWAERSGVLAIVLKEALPLKPEDYPSLRRWKKEMKLHPAVQATIHTPEQVHKCILMKFGKIEPDYDSV